MSTQFTLHTIPITTVVNGQSVEKVSRCKYLGRISDDELKWKLHTENVYKKVMLFYIPVFFMVLKYMQTPNLPSLIN